MANPLTQSKSHISESEQEILKKSRDDKYDILAVMLIGEDGDTARRIKVDSNGNLVLGNTLPTDGNNPSLIISNDDMVEARTQTITKIIGSKNYEKILSFNAGGDVIGVSAWSEV